MGRRGEAHARREVTRHLARQRRVYLFGSGKAPRWERLITATLITGILLTGGNAADRMIDRATGNRTRITPVTTGEQDPDGYPEAAAAFRRTHAVVGMGGYGQTDAFDALSAAAPVLGDYGTLYDVQYNPKGLDAGEVADEIADTVVTEEVRERDEKVYVTLMGLSTGGKFAVQVANELRKSHGGRVVPTLIIAVSSPFEAPSTRGMDKQTMARSSRWVQRSRFYVGPVGRTVGQLLYELRGDTGVGPFDVAGAWKRASVKPYDLQLSQLRVVADDFPVKELRRVRDASGVQVMYVRAADPARDRTVDVLMAQRQWRAALGDDRSFHVAKGRVGHAQFYLHPEDVQDMLAQALPATGLPTLEVFTVREVPHTPRRLGGPVWREAEPGGQPPPPFEPPWIIP